MRNALMILALFSAALLSAAGVDIPSMSAPLFPAVEVSTNIPLSVDAPRLQTLTFAVSFDTCETNEVALAIGTDLDANGNLDSNETSIVFGCDCGVWYCADYRTGDVETPTTGVLVIGKRQFDSSWNLVKVIRRGFGEIGESVTLNEEHVRFEIKIR